MCESIFPYNAHQAFGLRLCVGGFASIISVQLKFNNYHRQHLQHHAQGQNTDCGVCIMYVCMYVAYARVREVSLR